MLETAVTVMNIAWSAPVTMMHSHGGKNLSTYLIPANIKHLKMTENDKLIMLRTSGNVFE